MRHLIALFGMALTLVLAACSNPQYLIHPASNPAATGVRQTIDSAIESSTFKPLVWGSFFAPVKGGLFKPVVPTDSRNAIVYVYRPESDWSDNEVQSPGFFVNGQFISGLKNGSYFWFEVPASTYFFIAKRPLAVVYLTTIFQADVNLEGGQRYFYRYDEEVRGPKKPAKGSPMLVVGPINQMSEAQALPEIAQTRVMGPGKVLLADAQPQWTPFELYDNAQPVQASSYDATTPLPTQLRSDAEIQAEQDPDGIMQAESTSSWWNPTTWW